MCSVYIFLQLHNHSINKPNNEYFYIFSYLTFSVTILYIQSLYKEELPSIVLHLQEMQILLRKSFIQQQLMYSLLMDQ